jgi:regulator of sigma E protease
MTRPPGSPRTRLALSLLAFLVLYELVRDPIGLLNIGRNLVLFVVIITLVVGIHEFCHLLMARALGVDVKAYAIGFGHELIGRTRFGIRWSLNALWLGGYVKLVGEEGDEGPRSFTVAPAWKKVAILVVGPLSNLALAFVILFALAFVGHRMPFDQSVRAAGTILNLLISGTVNAVAGFIPVAASKPLDMPIVGIPSLVGSTGAMLRFGDGGDMLVVLTAAISFSMGIVNLLPIPPLDGGQAFVALLRGLLGRFYPARFMQVVAVGGLGLIVGFIVLVNGIDAIRTVIGYNPFGL